MEEQDFLSAREFVEDLIQKYKNIESDLPPAHVTPSDVTEAETGSSSVGQAAILRQVSSKPKEEPSTADCNVAKGKFKVEPTWAVLNSAQPTKRQAKRTKKTSGSAVTSLGSLEHQKPLTGNGRDQSTPATKSTKGRAKGKESKIHSVQNIKHKNHNH